MKLLQPVWVESIDSTNRYWQEAIKSSKSIVSGSILAAREQTAGRGRFDRKWLAKKGENLTFSIALQTDAAFPRIATIPMAVSLGIHDYFKTHNIHTQGKWPNDILVNSKKICGILSEKVTHNNNDYIIIGIGININMPLLTAEQIEKPATSLSIETGCSFDIEEELANLLPYISNYIDLWERNGFAGFKSAWCKIAWLYRQEVTIIDGKNTISGILTDFGEHGQMIIRLETDEVKEFWSGDVSVKR